MQRRLQVISLAGCCAIAGCGRDDAPPPQPRAEAESTATVMAAPSATQPAATQPSRPVVMVIDSERREFPAAKLVVQERNGKTVALLMSQDPPEAIKDSYTGNSYYLEMPFEELLPRLIDQQWVYEAPSLDRVADDDSPNGIFLDGNRIQLTPYQVKVTFQHVDGEDVVWIGGTFYQTIESDLPAPGKVVPLAARVAVKLP